MLFFYCLFLAFLWLILGVSFLLFLQVLFFVGNIAWWIVVLACKCSRERTVLNGVAWALLVMLFNIFLNKIYFLKILKKQILLYCQTDNPIASYALNSNNEFPIKQYLHSIKTYGIIPWQRNKEKEEPCIFQLGQQTEAVGSPWQRETGKRTFRRPWHKSTAEIQSLKGWWHIAMSGR